MKSTSGKLAIEGGHPVRSASWPAWPVWDDSDERVLVEALRSGKWGVGGERVPELECQFAGLHDARFGVACCNGTIALQIALIAAGIEPGDHVITTPYTFMATALSILAVDAIPVFVDVEPGTHNIDPNQIEAALTDRTSAIMPVHIGGRPADMDRINDIARRRGLKVVEDAAQAWLASWNATPVGAIGDAGTFSFQSSKNLTAGEGGMILTNDEDLFQRAWSYHNCGRRLGGAWYDHAYAGMNYRLTELQAALLLNGLARLPEQQARRQAAMAILERDLAGVPGVLMPDRDERVTAHACHILMVRLDQEQFSLDKMRIVQALQAEGIPAHPGYTVPLYKQDFFDWFADRRTPAGGIWNELFPIPFNDYSLPVCERLCASTIWIKQDVLLAGPEQMSDVVDAFVKVLEAAREGRLSG
ncbi:MAG: DegT/DnrJ/EryC1/StrS family aminotransferase [Acidobacteriota bacterium]|nr:MAG: DegT/DnrJ/EryC1/StrS family aminotransferase [Acidobacteriota bacterium]